MVKTAATLLFVWMSFTPLAWASQDLQINLELGSLWQDRNDVRIDPSTGTYFEFNNFNKGPFFHYRGEVTYNLASRHGLRLILAPLSLSVSGPSNQPIRYKNTSFTAGTPIHVDYQFNSYRLGYFYSLLDSSKHQLRLGFTGKIRDAQIRLQQSGVSETYSNLGFVPLFYLGYQLKIGEHWSLFTDLDFAAAPQGRAFDFTLKLRRDLSKAAFAGIGYRTLEGGADNDKVFTFSWFNYATLEWGYRF